MLTKLKSLDLSHNPLEDLQPDAFKDVTVINLINLFDVSALIKTFSRSKNLKVLKCRGCRLQNINPQLYNLLNQLLVLDIGNNQVT